MPPMYHSCTLTHPVSIYPPRHCTLIYHEVIPFALKTWDHVCTRRYRKWRQMHNFQLGYLLHILLNYSLMQVLN